MWQPELFSKAFALAVKAHASQVISGSDKPYIEHVVAVMMEALKAALTDSRLNYDLIICCGLLHDVVEDTPVSLESIEEQFGKQVAMGVSALTKNENLPKEERMSDSLKRILALQMPEINIVKMADRCDNLRQPPPHWNKQKIKSYYEEAIYIFETLRGVNQAIENRLAERIADYRRYWR